MPKRSSKSKRPLLAAQLQLHVAIVLFGFSAILGKLIQLPGTAIVWYRLLFTLLGLCFLPGLIGRVLRIPRPALGRIALIGVLLGLHWLTFFESIKYGNVSVTLSCFASSALFTAFIEPVFFRRRIRWIELLLGAAVILGFVFMFGFVGGKFMTGMLIAILSAVLIAVAGVLNKSVVGQYDVMAITWVEFLAGFGAVSLLLPLHEDLFPGQMAWPGKMDLLYLLLLALLCTVWGYTLMMKALRRVSAFEVMLSMNLEPIYGMLMAAFFFREYEELNLGFYLGAFLILLAVLVYALWGRPKNPV